MTCLPQLGLCQSLFKSGVCSQGLGGKAASGDRVTVITKNVSLGFWCLWCLETLIGSRV